ncbi:MAG: Anti-sigma-K factor rskA [Verrucomicrobiales bacterium]|nr:Anti-sigma-K factor rskA [Verrucomicrobiales bacterium]
MKPSPSPADPSGASEALAGAPPHLVARLAGRAPDAGQPSRAVLSAALLRIEAQRAVPAPPPRRGRRLPALPAWSGWAAAAGLTLLLAWEHNDFLTHGWHRHGDAGGGLARHPESAGIPEDGPSFTGDDGAGPDGSAGPSAGPHETKRSLSARNARLRAAPLTAVQDMARLRRDLAKLRAANEARFQAYAGLSRTVVVEMTDPTAPRGQTARLGAMRLSDRVAESIAAGITGDNSGSLAATASSDGSGPSPQTPESPRRPPPEQDLVLSGGDGSWSGDIVIEKGLPNTGLLNLPEGTQIKHLDFPVEDASHYRGLQDLGAGWFYDQFSDLVWQPTGEGRTYVGKKAPAGFDIETFTPPDTAVPQMVENPTATTPSAQPQETPAHPAEDSKPGSSATIPTEIAANTLPARGYPIFDETTGSGSIILQNLPNLSTTGTFASGDATGSLQPTETAGPGQTYQLWITDPAAAAPISVGLIPQLEGGNGRVWFDLGSPGVAPSGYLLTLEPATGSTVPSGRVVLQGP